MKLAKIISYLLHPVLFSTISTFLFFIFQPSYLPKPFKYKILSVIFLSTYVIPIVFLFILKQRNSIDSFHLKTISERKFPILFFLTITLLLGIRLLELNAIDLLAYSFIGVAFALVIVFLLLYSKLKISLHTLAVGGLIGFIITISYHYKMWLLEFITIGFLLFGVIATARLKLKAHTVTEVIFGFIIGLISQLITYYFLPIILLT